MASRQVVENIVQKLLAAYPRAPLHPDTLPTYSAFMSDIQDEVLLAAVTAHIATSEYFPTISQIRAAAAKIETGAGAAPDAYAAWFEVCEMMRQGHHTKPKFSHPFIDEIVSKMGWYDLRTSDNQISDRARFIEAYEALAARVVRQYALPETVRKITEYKFKLLEEGEHNANKD